MFATLVSETDYQKITDMVLSHSDGFDLMLMRLRGMFGKDMTTGHVAAMGYLMGWVDRGEKFVDSCEHFNRQN